MTSKEALERLCKVKIYQKEGSAYDYLGKEIYKEEINIIKQDLERLEQLEKDNKLLDETIEADDNIIQKLIKANQMLKDKDKELLKDFRKAIDIAQKYKKAIEILKRELFIDFEDCSKTTKNYFIHLRENEYQSYDYAIIILHNKKEYELLNEVLKDEKN